MYRILCDGLPLYDLRDDNLVLNSPKVSLKENNSGSLDFTILPTHPHYDDIKKMKSVIQVFDGEDEIFCGRVIDETRDFHKRKKITCEGELAYLNDTIQRPKAYHNQTVRSYFETLIEYHNSQVGKNRQFKVGAVTVVDSNDSVYKYTNWETTMQVIKTDLLDTYGGHLRIRKVDGVRYIDYLADYPNKNTQVIRFGENLLDFTHDIDATDIATAVIPLGAKLEESSIQGLEERLTISTPTNVLDYVCSIKAVNTYGWICKTVIFDDVHIVENLKRKGEQYLADIQFENVTLTVKALDLHMLDVDVERIKMLDEIRVVSEPNGLDRYFPVTEMTISLDKPSNNTIVLGQKVSSGMTGTASSNKASIMKKINEIPSETTILNEAKENASQMIHSALNGHVVTKPDEILIMDTDNIKTARKLWRWNLNGLGYSNNGYSGNFGLAMTMDGQIVGDRIVGGSVSAEKLDVNYRTSVEKAISDAQDNAEEHTDEELKKYWTRTQVETAIKTSKDEILLSAKETATAYTDDKLKSYSTSAQIKVKTDAIETEVKKKVNASTIISSINQSAESIAIKASKIKLEGLVTANKHFKIDAYGNMEAVNGKFTGTVTGSTITGSTMNIKSGDGCTLDINANGLTLNAKKTSDIFGHQGGLFTIGTTKSILDSMFSPITFSEPSGTLWTVPLAQNVSKFRFIWNAMSSSYLEITTFWGAYGLTAWASDRKLKDNIQESVMNASNVIKQFPHFQFDWKHNGYHVDCGYVAQELEKINKDFVIVVEDKNDDGSPKYNYQINETTIIPVLSKALQEVIERVERVEERMKING